MRIRRKQKTPQPKIIYLAHKYTENHRDKIVKNVNSAHKIGIEIMRGGHYVFNPIKNSSFSGRWGLTTIPDEYFYQSGLKFLSLCDYLVMSPGWENSKGCQLELRYWLDELKRDPDTVFYYPDFPVLGSD